MARAKKRATKRKPSRETSDPVSRIASKAMRVASRYSDDFVALVVVVGGRTVALTAGEIQAISASCLAQDQTRGKRKAR